jgi:sulfur-oxidizing protein SoxX
VIAGLVAIVAMVAAPAVAQPPVVAPYAVVGDAIPAPLTRTPGDAARGRAIVADRQVGMCLLCHRGPIPEERFQGTIGPDLAGVGGRLGAGQLRLRIVDMRRIHPASTMPAYHRVEGLERVAPAWSGKPILDAQQVEDVVAYLGTLRS